MIDDIKDELEKLVDPAKAQKRIEWEKKYNEPSTMYGIPARFVREVSSKYYRNVKKEGRKRILESCNLLLKQEIVELRTIAFDWAYRIREEFLAEDFTLFESWLERYVHGWGGCDDLCVHAFGALIYRFPQSLSKVEVWRFSQNRWMRRASAVTLVLPARKGLFLDDILDIADRLLHDDDDLVQKGYGWMLKEAGKAHPHEVFRFVMDHRKEMPRTALRYAIEKMPAEWKKLAMEK